MSRFSLLLALSCLACATPRLVPAGGFVQPLGRTHPLTGTLYAPRLGETRDPRALAAELGRARFVVIGETHDNRDHHRLEAELLGRFLARWPGAAVGFEMLDVSVREQLAVAFADPDELARRVNWSESGWPEFEQYRPVFARVLAEGAPIIAAHPTREQVRASMHGLAPDTAAQLKLDRPLPPSAASELAREIEAAHCGHAPAAMLDQMLRAQTFKDAFMANELIRAGRPAALVTGRGHARNDRAVPRFLRLHGARAVLGIGLIEVEDDKPEPGDYPEAAHFDLVVFTPRATDADACARFREQLEKLRARGARPE
jgi:uncharacterized iron-regulated protein